MSVFLKRVTVVLFVCFMLSVCNAGSHDVWIEVRTPNFIIVSSVGEKEANKVALQLEEIRTVFKNSIQIAKNYPTPVLTVLVVKDEASMRELLPEYWEKGRAHPAGVFLGSLNQFYAALELDAHGTNPYANFFHEYYHLLTTPYFPDLPLWLSEGLADFYGHTGIEEKRVVMGKPDPDRLYVLRTQSLVPLKLLMKVDHSSPYYNEQDKTSIFYAESWALTHYLMIGDRQVHKPMLTSYLQARSHGKSDDEATTEAFGDLTKLQSDLSKYIHNVSFFTSVMPRSASEYTQFAVRKLSEGEADAYLGGFAVLRGRTEDGESLLEESVRLEPNLALAYQNLAILEFVKKDREKTLQNLSKAITIDPKNAWTHYFRAYVTTNHGTSHSPNAQVDQDLRQSAALNPDFAPPYGLLAARLAILGGKKDFDEALALAQKAASLQPGNSTSQLELASVLSRMGRYDDAKAAASRAKVQASNPQERARAETFLSYLEHPQTSQSAVDSPGTTEIKDLNEARAAMREERFADAISILQKVVESRPTSKDGWNLLGLACLSSHRTEDAIIAFNRQIDLSHDSSSAYNNLGRAYWVNRQYENAERAFRKQLEVAPGDDRANGYLGTMYLEQHKYDQATSELEKATLSKPKDAMLQVNLGKAYLNLGQDEKAMAKFDSAVKLSATSLIWNNIAYELALKGTHLDLALQYAQLAVKTTSTSLYSVRLDQLSASNLALVSSLASYWDTLGWVYYAKADLGKAEKYVSAAWALAQSSAVADHLGQLYERRGEKEKALAAYALAFDKFRPADPETRQRFATILGGDDKVTSEWTKHREDLTALRTIRLQASGPSSGSADFFVLLAPSVRGTRVEAVKFIRGDERVRSIQDSLSAASFPIEFPQDTLVKVIVRGTLSCLTSGDCKFAMMLPQETRTTD